MSEFGSQYEVVGKIIGCGLFALGVFVALVFVAIAQQFTR